MRVKSLAVACATLSLAGCASQIVGTITLSQISSVAGIASTLATGKDLGEHALSLIMDKDCRFSEALISEERDICEEHGSPATRNDFEGVLIAGYDAEGKVVRAAPAFLTASEGEIEDSAPDAVWKRIREEQAKQKQDAEIRVAERTRRANDALLAFASSAPTTNVPVTTEVASATTLLTAPVVVARLDAPQGVAKPVTAATAPAAPRRKPVASNKVIVKLDDESAPRAGEEVQVASLSGSRLVVPLRKPVTLISSTAGAAFMEPVAELISAPTPQPVPVE